jgi:excisionase family DNA binding protein
MTLEQIVVRLSTNPKEMDIVSRILTEPSKADAPRPGYLKTYSFTEAAREIGVSRMTAFRLVQAGKLRTIETFNGRRRIPADELISFVKPK